MLPRRSLGPKLRLIWLGGSANIWQGISPRAGAVKTMVMTEFWFTLRVRTLINVKYSEIFLNSNFRSTTLHLMIPRLIAPPMLLHHLVSWCHDRLCHLKRTQETPHSKFSPHKTVSITQALQKPQSQSTGGTYDIPCYYAFLFIERFFATKATNVRTGTWLGIDLLSSIV